MRFYNSPKPFEFMQFRKTAGSEVDVVLLPTFVDVVFLDEGITVCPVANLHRPTSDPCWTPKQGATTLNA